jgi:hypothetical protein
MSDELNDDRPDHGCDLGQTEHSRVRDRGGVLPLVLVATITFSLVVASLAGYVAAGLRYGNVVEARADRLAAADGGLRYGIERLRNFQTLCTTGAGAGGGYTTVFPPEINGATTEVTCRRIGNAFSDVQGWGVVVTGAHVPSSQPLFITRGAGGATNNVKTFNGPLYVADPTRLDLAANLKVKDGDMWYSSDNCDVPVYVSEIDSGRLTFEPSFLRGTLCVPQRWDSGLFNAPTAIVPTGFAMAVPAAADSTSFPGCQVFSPGRYVGPLPLGPNNYFKSGDYYFEDTDLRLFNQSLLAGFPSGSGDSAKVSMPECNAAMVHDQTTSGERGGATFWLGGTSKIDVDTGGRLEIFRRQQAETYLSVVALDRNGTVGAIPFRANTNSFQVSTVINWLIETKSGNTNDASFHGLVWAPYSKLSLGNITNAANGQILGGLVIGQLDTQASNSAQAFSIGIEGNPIEARLLLESTATKDGNSTTIRAVVQYRPDFKELAVNSWRVVG